MSNLDRYKHQTLLKQIGESGQQKLLAAKVTIIGCGGLGSVAAAYLCGAGIGTLTIIDGDTIHPSNLHRQITYKTDSNQLKVDELQQFLNQLNPDTTVNSEHAWMTSSNISSLIQQTDLVLDCTDNIHTKYLINDYCHDHHIPLVYAGLGKLVGQVSLFLNQTENSIHLRDIFPEVDEGVLTCEEGGIINTLAGIIGLIQATEAIKYICDFGTNLSGYLLIYNLLEYNQFKFKLKKRKHTTEKQTTSSFHELSWQNILEHYTKYSFVLLDENIHLPFQTTNVIVKNLTELYDELPFRKEASIVVVCKRGKTSLYAAQILQEQGYQHIYNVENGWEGYVSHTK